MRLASGPALGLLAIALAGCSGDPAVRSEPDHVASTGSASAPSYIADRITLGSKPCGIQVAGDRVWVSNYGDATVQWFDRRSAALSAPVQVGSEPCGLVVGGGAVWVEDYGSDEL